MNTAFEDLHLSTHEEVMLLQELETALQVSTRNDVGLDVTVLGLGSLSHPHGPGVEESDLVRKERHIRLLQARWCGYLADVFKVVLPVKDQHYSFIDLTFTQQDILTIRNMFHHFKHADVWAENLEHKTEMHMAADIERLKKMVQSCLSPRRDEQKRVRHRIFIDLHFTHEGLDNVVSHLAAQHKVEDFLFISFHAFDAPSSLVAMAKDKKIGPLYLRWFAQP